MTRPRVPLPSRLNRATEDRGCRRGRRRQDRDKIVAPGDGGYRVLDQRIGAPPAPRLEYARHRRAQVQLH